MRALVEQATQELMPRLRRLRGELRWARRELTEAYELAVVPNAPAAGATFWPSRLATALLRAARARLDGGAPVHAGVPPAALPSGRRPLVLHVIDGVTVGGSQKITFDLVRRLGSRWDMQIVTSGVSGDDFGNLPIVATGNDVERVLGRRPALVHLHCWGRTPWIQRALAAIERCCPGVPVLENMNNPGEAWHHPAVRHVAYVSRWLADGQREPGADHSVVYPGVDTDAFTPAPELPRDEVLGLVYRLERDKLSEGAVDVLIDIARRRPRVRVVIVGTGSLFRPWVQRIRAAGVRDRFELLGRVPFDALPDIYRRFSLFIAPVHRESYGVVVPYALAMNIPVCGYRVGALPELVGDHGALADTPEALAALAAGLLADYPQRVALGARARARAVERFSEAAMIDAYDALYQRLVSA